jgi:hypothetical protein
MNSAPLLPSTSISRILLAIIALAGCILASPAWAERKVTLAWDGSIDTATSGYIVYAYEENTTLLARVDVGGNTYAEIDGLKEGLSYTFYVTAYNPYYVESPPSLPVNFQVPVPLQMVSGAGIGAGRIRFPAAPGRSYELQASTDLMNWSTIWQTGVVNKYAWLEYQDPRARYYVSRFYKLIVR